MKNVCETAHFEPVIVHTETLGKKVSSHVYSICEARRAVENTSQMEIVSHYEDKRQSLINKIIVEGIQHLSLAKAADAMLEKETTCIHAALPFDLATARYYMIELSQSTQDINLIYIRDYLTVRPLSMSDFCQRIENTTAYQTLKAHSKKEELFIALQVFPVVQLGESLRVIRPLPDEYTPKTMMVLTISTSAIDAPFQLARRDVPQNYNGSPVIDVKLLIRTYEEERLLSLCE